MDTNLYEVYFSALCKIPRTELAILAFTYSLRLPMPRLVHASGFRRMITKWCPRE